VFSILAFLVLVVPLAFAFKTQENFELPKFVLWLVLLGWALIAYLFDNGVSAPGRTAMSIKGNKPFFIVLGNFLFWAALATVFSVDRMNSAFGFYYRFTSGLLFYGTWALFLLLLVKTLDKGRFVFLAKLLVFDGVVVALWGFLNSLGIGYYEDLSPAGFLRAPSLLGNPNFSTMFLACVLPFAVVLGLTAKRFWAKIGFFTAAILMILTTAALASRGAILAMIVSLVTAIALLAWQKARRKQLWLAALAFVLCVAFSVVFVRVARPSALKISNYFTDDNVTLRLLVWKVSLKGMAERPLLGIGPGNFQIFFERYRNQHIDQKVYIFDDAHNLFLQMGETTGIPFLASFLGLFVLAAAASLWSLKRQKDPMLMAGLVAIAAFVVSASFTPVSIPNFMLLAILLAGLLLPAVKEYFIRLPKGLYVAGVAAGAVLIIAGTNLITAEYLYAYGYRAYLNGDYAKAYALTVVAAWLNPTNANYFAYRTGSEIYLGKPIDLVESHIENVKNMHPLQARSMLIASNLYDNLYYKTGQKRYLEKAIAELNESLNLDSKTGERYAQLGLLYYQLGDVSAAKDNLYRGLAIKEGYLPSLVLLAKISQEEGDRERMMTFLEEVYKLDPNNAQVRALWQYAKREPDPKKVPIQFMARLGSLE